MNVEGVAIREMDETTYECVIGNKKQHGILPSCHTSPSASLSNNMRADRREVNCPRQRKNEVRAGGGEAGRMVIENARACKTE